MTALTAFALITVIPAHAAAELDVVETTGAAIELQHRLNTHDEAQVADAVDTSALVRRAGDRARDRRAARAALRDGQASLARQIDADEQITLLGGDATQATYRALDARGHVDYLFVHLTPEGQVADWMWMSDGQLASDHIAPDARPRRSTFSDVVIEAPAEASDLQQLELRVDDRDWDAFEASVDRLDTAVGGDPWLDVLRGIAATLRGDEQRGAILMQAARSMDESLVEQAYLPGHGGDRSRW